ncbi:MAG: hypothetical protein AWM53_00632 [Candidatus Dichloromethanomonas elyunquensis]|nr:MAG: hypothetical protein AWM53_00632 [Candidatus Dichloromethanomonas elyunquensis]
MIKNFSEKIGLLLDRLSQERLIILGGLSILFISVFFYIGIMVPLRMQTDAQRTVRNSFSAQIQKLEMQNTDTLKKLSRTTDLPEAVNYLKDCFLAYGANAEEIQLTPMAALGSGSLQQAGVKMNLTGEQDAVFQALSAAQNNTRFPLLVRQIEVNASRIEVQLQILMVEENKMVNSGT